MFTVFLRASLLVFFISALSACASGSDSAGPNSTYIPDISDKIAPVVQAPAMIEIEAIDSMGIASTHNSVALFLSLVTVTDNVDESLTISNDVPQQFQLGTTVVTFTATDSANNTGQAQTQVTVSDQATPLITLNGAASMSIIVGTTFIDPGANASDNVDGDISQNVLVSGSVNSTQTGLYTLKYNVSDAAGNAASQLTRYISVQAAGTPVVQPPVNITLYTSNTTGLAISNGAIDQFLKAVSATDDIDTTFVFSNDAPQQFPLGTTVVTFSTTDSQNLTGQAQATVTVALSDDVQAFNRAVEQYTLSNYFDASILFNAFLTNFPDSGLVDRAQLYAAKSSYWLGLLASARTELDIVINIPAAQVLLAEAYYWKGKVDAALLDYVSARNHYQVVLSTYSTSAFADDATYGIASTYYDEKNYAEAEIWFRQGLDNFSLNSKTDNSQYYLAKSIHAQGRFTEARTEYSNLIGIYPGSTWLDNAQLQIGQTYFDEKNYAIAITELEKVAIDYPASNNIGEARYYIARSEHESGLFTEARLSYQAMMRDYPLDNFVDNAQFRIGQSYFDEAEVTLNASLYSLAITELQKVINNYVNSSSADTSQYYIVKSYLADNKVVDARAANGLLRANYPASVFIDNAAYLLAKNSYDVATAATTPDVGLFNTAISEFLDVITNTQGSDDIAQYYLAKSYHKIARITGLVTDYDIARAEYAKHNAINYPSSIYLDNAVYQTAKTYHDQADYITAITELARFTVDYALSTLVDDAHYYLGHSYRKQNIPDYITARSQYNLVLNYPDSLKLDNAQYYIAYTYHLENNCAQEQLEMQKLLDNYATSSFVSRAQTHIDGIIALTHTCL